MCDDIKTIRVVYNNCRHNSTYKDIPLTPTEKHERKQ